MTQEIEVKVSFTPNDRKTFQNWLDKNATFIKAVTQKDIYFDSTKDTFIHTTKEGFKDADIYLRLRLTNKAPKVTLKRYKIYDNDELNHANEDEFDVSDAKEFENFLETLGFKRSIIIDKTREIYETDEIEISIDTDSELGELIELELKKEYEDAEEGINALYDFIKNMGIRKCIIFTRGFVVRKWNPDMSFEKRITL